MASPVLLNPCNLFVACHSRKIRAKQMMGKSKPSYGDCCVAKGQIDSEHSFFNSAIYKFNDFPKPTSRMPSFLFPSAVGLFASACRAEVHEGGLASFC